MAFRRMAVVAVGLVGVMGLGGAARAMPVAYFGQDGRLAETVSVAPVSVVAPASLPIAVDGLAAGLSRAVVSGVAGYGAFSLGPLIQQSPAPAPVPEPATLGLVGAGLLGLAMVRRSGARQ